MKYETNFKHETKKLGKHEFTLCPSVLTERADASFPLLERLFVLIISPLLIVLISIMTLFMVLGPKSLRQNLISKFIPKTMARVANQYKDVRKTLLSPEMISNCKILDVGSGGGAYMQLLSSASKIVALEPITKMHPIIRNVAQDAGIEVGESIEEGEKKYDASKSQLEILACGIEEYIETHPEEIHSFDWVILGNVLCEVPSQSSTLKSVDKLLKIGGHVYFSEHVGYKIGSTMRKIQDACNPWWRIVSGGCNCNRDTVQEIEKMKYHWDIISWDYSGAEIGQGPPLIGPFHLGLALKTNSGKEE